MSGIALLMTHDGFELEAGELESVMAALGHRGPDGAEVVREPGIIIGHQHFWTLPEEVGTVQPWMDNRVVVALDGRIDNRDELGKTLGLVTEELAQMCDAELLVQAWHRWAESCFEHLLGPFAVAVYDRRDQRLLCARDPLGDRALFYFEDHKRLLMASEEGALLAHPDVPQTLDQQTLAHYFAVQAPARGATFFSAIRSLPPGHLLIADRRPGSRSQICRYWQPRTIERLRGACDRELAERFRATLDAAVRCRLRSLGAPSIQMSGGLDSTSVTALAATANPEGRPLHTVSWVFDEIAQADERVFVEAMAERFGLDAELIRADDCWPLCDLETWTPDPGSPQEGLYRAAVQRTYAAVRGAGNRVMLDGMYGDHLFYGQHHWLREHLQDRRWSLAFAGTVNMLFGRGLPVRSRMRALATAMKRLRPAADRPQKTPWLTCRAAALLAASDQPRWPGADRPEQVARVLDPLNPYGSCLARARAQRAGVEVRSPYRDRRLVELVLALPAAMLGSGGWSKLVLRQAMRELLPEEVCFRWSQSSLAGLARVGLTERARHTVIELLTGSHAAWPEFVHSDWLIDGFDRVFRDDGIRAVVGWHCASFELWRRRTAVDLCGNGSQTCTSRQADTGLELPAGAARRAP